MPLLVSIVIPALNEAAWIEQTLLSIRDQAPPFEIIVADGGSRDATKSLARPMATVIDSVRGRANQMNAGAAEARGEILLFLHADTLLPRNALSLIRSAVREGAESGNFRLKFDKSSPLLNFYSFFTRFKLRLFSFGDRGLFIRRELFESLGRFAPIPIFEDLELVKRLYARDKFVFLPAEVITAARRFEQRGHFRQQLLNSYLWIRYVMGAQPAKLARYYTYGISNRDKSIS